MNLKITNTYPKVNITQRHEDLTGQIFGKLKVLYMTNKKNNKSMWVCECFCGNIKAVRAFELKNGDNTSCGCQKNRKKHGQSKTATYTVWENMKTRCLNPKHIHFKYYGGRGITVCERWLSFENFYLDMGERPTGTTLDRVNGDLGYYAENCRWVEAVYQTRNKKMQSNNTTGTTGVFYDKSKSSYIVTWSEEKKQRSKSFSVNRYGGKEQTYFVACEFRRQQIERLNSLGYGYSEKHGV